MVELNIEKHAWSGESHIKTLNSLLGESKTGEIKLLLFFL